MICVTKIMFLWCPVQLNPGTNNVGVVRAVKPGLRGMCLKLGLAPRPSSLNFLCGREERGREKRVGGREKEELGRGRGGGNQEWTRGNEAVEFAVLGAIANYSCTKTDFEVDRYTRRKKHHRISVS
jgi:hypothetical protein